MCCNGCPFNDGFTLEATQAQNWGCLPTQEDMVSKWDNEQVALSCHEHNNKPCKGLVNFRPEAAFGKVLSYSNWYKGS